MAPRTTGGSPRPKNRALGPAAGVAAFAAMTALSARCRADDLGAFELAKNPFDAGRFTEAHARFSTLVDDPSLPSCDSAASATGRCRLSDPDLVERTRAMDAASLLALKREAEADEQIKHILRKNPQYAPNPALFPQEVIDRFTLVRGMLRPELEAIEKQRAREELARRVAVQKAREAEEAWIFELQKLAEQQTEVRTSSRWVAMVPFGVGQFQNGDTKLGVAFAVGEVLFGGAAVGGVAAMFKLTATTPANDAQRQALNSQLRTVGVVNQVGFAGWAALAVAGVIQAQVAFVPEKPVTVKRKLPPRPRLAPVATPLPGGGYLGLGGTF
jgi:hypothetical protein